MSLPLRLLLVLLLATAVGSIWLVEDKPDPFDARVTFVVTTPQDEGETTRGAETTLAVTKRGRTPLPAPETQRGRHTFPPFATGEVIAGFYAGLLEAIGWRPGADFDIEGATIVLYAVDTLEARADSPEVRIVVSR